MGKQWCSECEHFSGLVKVESGTLHCPRDTRDTAADTCTNYTAETAEEEETDMSDRIEESTFTQELPCELTQEEMLHRSRRAAQIVKEIEDEQASMKSSASRHKAKIEQLSGEARVIAIEIREERTHKDVDCKTIRDFGAKTVSEVRLDTGEVLEIRAMTFAELQRELDLTPKAPKPKDATCTEPEPELEKALQTIKNPDGTGETRVYQKGFGDTEFRQIGGPPEPEPPILSPEEVSSFRSVTAAPADFAVAAKNVRGKRKPRAEKPKRNGKTKPGVTHPDDVIGDGGEAL